MSTVTVTIPEGSMKPYYADNLVTLYHGDCLEVLPALTQTTVDFVCTDPPYGMTDCDWDTAAPLEVIWPLLRTLLTPTGSIAMTASQPFSSTVVASNAKAFKHEWIWEKNAGSNFGTVKRQPMKEHESVLVFAWGRYYYEPIMQPRAESGLARVKSGVVNYATKAEAYGSGGLTGVASSHRPDLRYPRSIQRFNRERGLHPTQKPIALMRYLIDTYSPPGALILDPYAGSGTAGVAASISGRRAILVEREEKYCEIIAKRLDQMCLDFGSPA